MPSIGGIPCTFVRGAPHAPAQRVQLWEVPGIDGYGAQLLGLGDSPFQFAVVLLDSLIAANVYNWAQSVQATPGTIATIVNDWGTSYTRCLIVKTSAPKYTPWNAGAKGEIVVEGVVLPPEP